MADAFTEGLQLGSGAVARGLARGAQRRRDRLDEEVARQRMGIEEKESREKELDRQIERRHQTLLADDLEIQGRIRKDQATRYIEAEANWAKYEEAVKSIRWDDPQAPYQYEAITASYLPGIVKHESTAKKFESFDKATKDSMKYTAAKITEAAGTASMNEAARIAPWLTADPPKKPDGTIDWTAFAASLKAAREEERKAQENLREISARAYRGRTKPTRPTLGETEKGMLGQELKVLSEVRSRLLDMDEKGLRTKDPDRYLRLQNEERRIRHRIEQLRATATPAAESETVPDTEPAPETTTAPAGATDDPLNLFGQP